MYEATTQIAGAIVVFDMEGLSMSQAWQFTPQFAKRIVDWLQVGFCLVKNGFYTFSTTGKIGQKTPRPEKKCAIYIWDSVLSGYAITKFHCIFILLYVPT